MRDKNNINNNNNNGVPLIILIFGELVTYDGVSNELAGIWFCFFFSCIPLHPPPRPVRVEMKNIITLADVINGYDRAAGRSNTARRAVSVGPKENVTR